MASANASSFLFLYVIAEMKHVQGSGFSFDHRMAHKYLSRIKEAVHAGIWEQLCPEWFECTDDGKTLKFDEGYIIEKFTADIRKENQLDGHFIIEFENSKVEHIKLSEDFFHQSFYCNEKVYNIAKPESCILMDIALAKGSPEAIAESFCASMRCQQQPGGQTNENILCYICSFVWFNFRFLIFCCKTLLFVHSYFFIGI